MRWGVFKCPFIYIVSESVWLCVCAVFLYVLGYSVLRLVVNTSYDY